MAESNQTEVETPIPLNFGERLILEAKNLSKLGRKVVICTSLMFFAGCALNAQGNSDTSDLLAMEDRIRETAVHLVQEEYPNPLIGIKPEQDFKSADLKTLQKNLFYVVEQTKESKSGGSHFVINKNPFMDLLNQYLPPDKINQVLILGTATHTQISEKPDIAFLYQAGEKNKNPIDAEVIFFAHDEATDTAVIGVIPKNSNGILPNGFDFEDNFKLNGESVLYAGTPDNSILEMRTGTAYPIIGGITSETEYQSDDNVNSIHLAYVNTGMSGGPILIKKENGRLTVIGIINFSLPLDDFDVNFDILTKPTNIRLVLERALQGDSVFNSSENQ